MAKEKTFLSYSNEKINVRNITKLYYVKKDSKKDNKKNRKRYQYFEALDEITFTFKPGQCVGLVGLNGSGKTTLANILAKHLKPTYGEFNFKGTTSLLAISSGLKPNLTGRENIRLKMLLMGFSNKEINRRINKIIEFTELYDFIDKPLKHYSSGMRAKLGFGIAVQTDPDILIIDEALSVGDQTFYRKCLDEIEKFKSQKKTIIFVSHATSQMRDIADVVAWIHYGKLRQFGECEAVCLEYSKFIHHFNKLSRSEKNIYQKKMMSGQERKLRTKIKHDSFKFPIISVTILFFIVIITGFKLIGIL
ncbi:ABC transporter ATP-binding protein [Enterococcus faecium]|uniref:ABC transporter ATP-binding protein n=1 Tax=Enterococcus faecium TaxID=1352 RepID=UPI000BEF9307|nr:ATP-binding cassette domain-containing protein [Enterococcus faecium]PEH49701.1 teichoic acid export protein ATP-binding subunit [Enterococcus faecium]